MAIIQHKPTTSARRNLRLVNKRILWKGKPEKALTFGVTRSGGRNHHGRLTAPRRGSAAHKKVLRIVDVKRTSHWNLTAEVVRIEYDPNRTAHLALIQYENGDKAYILATAKMQPGNKVMSGDNIELEDGNATQLKNIPNGFTIHNVEFKIGKGGQIAKAAGAYAQILGREGNHVRVRMKSGTVMLIHENCMATIGTVSNADHANEHISKAGRNRWKGIRPRVRAVAKNPIDHPMGGGNGKTSGGRHPCSRNGQAAKGLKTRNNKRTDKWIRSK